MVERVRCLSRSRWFMMWPFVVLFLSWSLKPNRFEKCHNCLLWVLTMPAQRKVHVFIIIQPETCHENDWNPSQSGEKWRKVWQKCSFMQRISRCPIFGRNSTAWIDGFYLHASGRQPASIWENLPNLVLFHWVNQSFSRESVYFVCRRVRVFQRSNFLLPTLYLS